MHKIELMITAIDDLQEISYYISIDNPFQAKKVLEDIYSSIKYLETFPFLGKERKDGLREIVAKHKYRVFYKIEQNIVYVVSIFKYKDFI